MLLDEYASVYPTFYEVDYDVIDALRRLRTLDWKVGVVTNGPPSQLRKLEVPALIDEVDAVCVSGLLGVRKPDRRIFEEAAKRCGRALSGWMVGDSASADVVGGHGAGLRTIWMSRSRTWELVDRQPDGLATSVPEAVEILLK